MRGVGKVQEGEREMRTGKGGGVGEGGRKRGNRAPGEMGVAGQQAVVGRERRPGARWRIGDGAPREAAL